MNESKTSLSPTFSPKGHFYGTEGYSLLPFNLGPLDEQRHVLTNIAGEHIVIPKDDVSALVEKRLTRQNPLFAELESRHFLSTGSSDAHLELLAAQIRTRHARLPDLAGLHMFVVTLRCNHSCGYCQVSRVSEDRRMYDMSETTADRAVDLMLQGPASRIKVEFQGGESLLNFPIIRRIIERVKTNANGRDVAFVVATNLTVITDEMLDYFAKHQVCISTSLDGPEELHNANRPNRDKDSFQRVLKAIGRCRERLGPDSVSALMTCSAASLTQAERIIEEYARQGFTEIFLRSMSPYGFAVRSATYLGYEVEQFLDFYRRGISYIIDLNKKGISFRETYASIILRRMLTPYATGYVDLQSPTGAGFGALLYNYNGDVYASDEGRMLAEMGDTTFRLGNVYKNDWVGIYRDSSIIDIAYRSMTEGMPECSECPFHVWCGSDPVRHHATQGDIIGHRPTSSFCKRNMGVMRHLVGLLEDDLEAARILRKWSR